MKKWFTKPIPTSVPPITYNNDTLQLSEDSNLTFLSVSDLLKEKNTCPQKRLLEKEDYSLSPTPSTVILHNSLTNTDCLFSIRYTPENTLKLCWFLVQINHAESNFLNTDSKPTSDYHVTFILRHPKDSSLCDEKAR